MGYAYSYQARNNNPAKLLGSFNTSTLLGVAAAGYDTQLVEVDATVIRPISGEAARRMTTRIAWREEQALARKCQNARNTG